MRLWKKRQVIAGIISENTPKHRISRKKSINWVRILPNQHHTGHGQCSLSQRKLFSFQSKEGSGGKRWTHKCKAEMCFKPKIFETSGALGGSLTCCWSFPGQTAWLPVEGIPLVGVFRRKKPMLSTQSDSQLILQFQRKVIPSWFYNFNAKWFPVDFTISTRSESRSILQHPFQGPSQWKLLSSEFSNKSDFCDDSALWYLVTKRTARIWC